ncbi:MAG: carbon-nitrogen hydrolase family protein [Blastomonas sp.]
MRIALLQMTGGIDPAANARLIENAIADAASGGAAMLFTPEMSNFLDRNRKRAVDTIRSEDRDMVLDTARKAAARHGIWVALGSIAVTGEEGKEWCNRAVVIDDKGGVRARYDKMHLFDVDLETGESWRESAVYAGGEGPVLVETPLGPVGLSICYDLRFPALYERLSDAGAKILTVPAAFTVPTGEAHWHVLLRARAIEATAYVIAAAQTGAHEDGRETYGHSLVIDPWGRVLLDMGTGPGLGFADLDPAEPGRIAARVPSLANRRKIGEVRRC